MFFFSPQTTRKKNRHGQAISLGCHHIQPCPSRTGWLGLAALCPDRITAGCPVACLDATVASIQRCKLSASLVSTVCIPGQVGAHFFLFGFFWTRPNRLSQNGHVKRLHNHQQSGSVCPLQKVQSPGGPRATHCLVPIEILSGIHYAQVDFGTDLDRKAANRLGSVLLVHYSTRKRADSTATGRQTLDGCRTNSIDDVH